MLTADQIVTLAMIRVSADGRERDELLLGALTSIELGEMMAIMLGDNETMKDVLRQDLERLKAQYEEHIENPWTERPTDVSGNPTSD